MFIGVGITNGPPNLWGGTLEWRKTTNTGISFYRDCFAILIQDVPFITNGLGPLQFGSNWIHALFLVHPDNTDIQISAGTPGVFGFQGIQVLSKGFYTNSISGIGDKIPFTFSIQFVGHNTLVARVGNYYVSGTLPWIDACRGTNAAFEFIPEAAETNWLNGQVYARQLYAGNIPQIPDFYPTLNLTNAFLTGGSYTNNYNDTLVGVPAASTRTNRLPAAGAMIGRTLIVFDAAASASGTNIWVVPAGSDKINGNLTKTNIVTDGGALTVIATADGWHILSRY